MKIQNFVLISNLWVLVQFSAKKIQKHEYKNVWKLQVTDFYQRFWNQNKVLRFDWVLNAVFVIKHNLLALFADSVFKFLQAEEIRCTIKKYS